MIGKNGGPPGLGPVFAYEWLTASRRWQGYALRSLFLLMLLAALLIVWFNQRDSQVTASFRRLAAIGSQFYVAVIGTQLTLVLLAAPAATAGAICLDRARGTLAHLLVTDLTDGEIVLGKLAARLVPVLGLVGCTLPVMALLTLLGGVDPDAMLGAFVVTLGVAVLGCGLALAFSLRARKTHEALLGTYAIWCLWLLAPSMVRQVNAVYGTPLPMPPKFSDPYLLAFAPYWSPGSVGWGDYLAFLAGTLAVSAALGVWTVLTMRAVCTREVSRRPRMVARPVALLARLPRLPGPSLDGNPVLWREWHRARPSRWARVVGLLYFGLAAAFSLTGLWYGGRHNLATVNGLQVAAGLLILSVSSATSLAEERVRGSLDVLLATPLPTRRIVLGKWLGAFRLVPALSVLPVSVLLFGAPYGVYNLGGAGLMLAFMLCSGAAVTSLGLGLATWSPRPGRALGLTVGLYVLVTVGWFFVPMMIAPPGPDAEGMMMLSPFAWGAVFCFEFCGTAGSMHNLEWAVFWTFGYLLAASGLFLATLATFDRCLGRVEGGFSHRGPARKPVVLQRIDEVTPSGA